MRRCYLSKNVSEVRESAIGISGRSFWAKGMASRWASARGVQGTGRGRERPGRCEAREEEQVRQVTIRVTVQKRKRRQRNVMPKVA